MGWERGKRIYCFLCCSVSYHINICEAKTYIFGLIPNWGFEKEWLIKKGLWRTILNFHSVWYVATMVYYCVHIIKTLKNSIKNPIIIGFYINLFESLIDLQSIVHIIYIYKWMQEECIKWCNWFHIFCTRKSYFPLCNYMFIRLIWWKNKSYEKFKNLKFWDKRLQGKCLLNHLAIFKNSFDSKKINSKCKSHVQEIIMQKNMFN
jgi:hypothetical protein